MDFVTVSTGLILPYWMGLPIRYIQFNVADVKPEFKATENFFFETLPNVNYISNDSINDPINDSISDPITDPISDLE